ncbi:MAG: aminotransferase class III-fold pyridoxal phosphate-dependent enzyme [Candidatus Omnitrophica bacterium]|nr:aminotransferase class III-fold pyridoxal phosphate-dependent enzyme [Candidatus Omnitrophota bacterium]
MEKGQQLYKKARNIIPGGTQLLSKRPELHLPELWPAYYDKARGCRVWDLEGNIYTDMSYMGIGSCILGYSDRDVDNAVKMAVDKGTMSTLNCPEEVELAGILCDIHGWADMVRFSRTGGEAAAMAVRIARASTGRDIVLFCGYHGWHDWYLSANLADDSGLDGHLLPGLEPRGVPRELKGTSIPFQYNDSDGFLALLEKYRSRIAAVIMEPVRNLYPTGGFLETIRDRTQREGIILIFDEITSGWRLNHGGAHLGFGVDPDMAVFAKGISNGYPMAAVIGRENVMTVAQDTFISSTYWTERIGPVAAISTIGKMSKNNVPGHLKHTGSRIKAGWRKYADEHGLEIEISGIDPLGHFTFSGEKHLVLKTLFTQYMLERGFLATNAFYASYAHKDEHVDKYLDAVSEVFGLVRKAADSTSPEDFLKKKVCHSGFRRLT